MKSYWFLDTNSFLFSDYSLSKATEQKKKISNIEFVILKVIILLHFYDFCSAVPIVDTIEWFVNGIVHDKDTYE